MITITKEQMDYLNELGVDIREPLERDDLQGVLDTIDDKIVFFVQCEEYESRDLSGTISKLQRVYDQIGLANWADDK